MSDLNPSETEQAEMNAEFEKASISERSKLGLLVIPISEFISILASITLPREDIPLKEAIIDLLNTLITRKRGKTELGKYTYDLLARAYNSHKKSMEKGKKGMRARWGTNSNK